MPTTVVNIHHKSEYDVYIGRAGKGQDGPFGNPFSEGSRELKISQFKEYFHKRLRTDFEFKKQVKGLKNKVLGCFCAPKPCHGNVIADYLNSLSPLKYAVVGSRNFSDYRFMQDILQWFEIKQVISGGAAGADSLARQYANSNNIPVIEHLPNWDLYGKSAGFRRNKTIVENSDEVIAFWDGSSKGTKHSIDIATEMGKPVHIFWPSIGDDIAELGL